MNNKEIDTIDLLSHLSELGVVLRAEGDRLQIDAPKGVLDALMFEELSQRKIEILQLLAPEVSEKNHEILPILKAPREGSLCTSFSQERLWFLSQLEPDSIAYNISLGIKLSGQLQADILKKSLDETLRRHEILRTTFGEKDGVPVQIVLPVASCDVQFVNLQELPEAQRAEQERQIVTCQSLTPFDLSKGPLFRAVLIQLDREEYNLTVTMHHIVTDRWSLGILIQEIKSLYSAYSEGRPSPLPELPIQYADFAYSQRKWLESGILESQIAFWKQKLSGDLQMLQLPVDRKRPVVQTHRGVKKRFTLTRELTDNIVKFCRQQRVTLFMGLLAAFKVLLYRYSGQTDFAVGSPVANRNRTEVEGLIGFFVNTLVLRTDLSGDPYLLDLLDKVKVTVLEAMSNQDTPFEKIVEIVNPKRDMSYSPLFQVMLTLQNTPRASTDLAGWSFFDTGASMFDLTLYLWEEEKGLAGEIEYSIDLFDSETIDQMAVHFRILLESVVADPTQRLSELSILLETERHQLLIEWNATGEDYPKGKSLGLLFEEQAGRAADSVAVVCKGVELTYGELNIRVNQLAGYLRKMGVGPDIFVGICMDRSVDMVVGLLGVLKAGGAYVPLDPGFPRERLKFMLEDSGAPVLISQKSLSEEFPGYRGKVVCIDSDWERIAQESVKNPEAAGRPEDLSYVIYTSGSTGKPKGVQIPNRAVVNFLYSMSREPGMNSADTVLSVTTISFDIFGLELFLPLITGARVVLAQWEDAADGARLIELLRESGASVMQATPATWRLLLQAGWKGDPLLRIFCGGEALPHDLVGPLLDRCKEFWNLYGPTETTIWSTVYQIESKEDPILIGRPIANTQIYILDKSLQPVPIGVAGELHIGGDGLARGYLNRPELTAEKFIPNPFSEDPNERIYKTGDLARYRPDGSIECLGRMDHQVKVRGFRIELGEIEATLAKLDEVGQCAVAVREDRPGDQRLVAYYVASGSEAFSTSDWRNYLRSQLPEYMVPQHFVKLEAMPLTPNGKVDRKALPAISDQPEENLANSFVAANDALEMQLTKIWESVLGVKPIGIKDNFFDIGGHSLLAARLFSRIDKAMGLKIPLATLFQAPTVELFARIIRDKNWDAGWSSLVPIQPGGSKPPLFFVHGAGGNVLLYRELALNLGADQPFYGLQSQGLDGKKPCYKCFEDMAAHYMQEIQSFQPEGPYYLGGYCLGGAIALEIAQQLSRKGQVVAMIAMIETYNARADERALPFYYNHIHRLQNLKYHWDNLWLLSKREKWRFISTKFQTEMERAKLGMLIGLSKIFRRLGLALGQNYPHVNMTKINDEANWQYFPEPYPGKITVFRPKTHYLGLDSYDFGWGEVAQGGVEVKTLPVCARGTLVEPFVRELALQLKQSIEKSGTEH